MNTILENKMNKAPTSGKENGIHFVHFKTSTDLILDISYNDGAVGDELRMNCFDFRFVGHRRLNDV